MHGAPNVTAFVAWAHKPSRFGVLAVGQWEETVVRFASLLRRMGITADVDAFHFHDPDVDWTRYGERAIDESDYTLVAVSQEWKERWEGQNQPTEGAGSVAEANALRSLFARDQRLFQRKVKLVVLPGQKSEFIPSGLHGVVRFQVNELTEEGVEDLVRTLTGKPKYVPPPLGALPVLPQSLIATPSAEPTSRRGELDQIAADLRVMRAVREQLPTPDLGDGPHLPWFREWERVNQRIASLEQRRRALEAEPGYRIEEAEHTHSFDENGFPLRDVVVFNIRAEEDGVDRLVTWREYTTDLRRGVITIVPLFGCELGAYEEDAEGRVRAELRFPGLSAGDTHILAFDVEFRTAERASVPWILGTPRWKRRRMTLRARFHPNFTPKQVWRADGVASRSEVPTRWVPELNVEPYSEGLYSHTFVDLEAQHVYGLVWSWPD